MSADEGRGSPTTGGEARFQGVTVTALAEEFGTPLFVYDADVLEATYRGLRARLPKEVDVFYSLKANPNISVCAFLGHQGAGAEVSSHAELVTALRAGVAPQDIIFLGPGKDTRELAACVDAGIHAVVCESLDELVRLDALARQRGVSEPCPVLLRVNPSFGSKGSGLAMGGKPRQFGIDEEEVRRAKDTLADLQHVRVRGVHAYMGTRFLHHADVVRNTAGILAMAEDLAGQLGVPLETVDFGGGLGVAYFDNEEDLDLDALGTGMREAVGAFVARHPKCRLIMELGRFLTAAAGTYVVRAREVKQSRGEWFIVADGGTNHHMAAVGIGSFVKRNFPVRHLGHPAEPALCSYTLTGPLCTPNDVIAKKFPLPAVRPGDLLGVERSGAYGPTASPGLFLSHGFPAEVLVHRGRARLVRERDTTEDLLAKQHLVGFGHDGVGSR
ncbi:type III PLP-dependent enzyme [Streptomyces turgidiscabies]|uniref:Putative diaminopimelate decarboxylase n=1 Tax=Streptomyces turgidiscabies (strain Car8) TaxID=698760 RepID=L7FJ11_STRT8|nr:MULTISPECIES: type III PLP-dependent enzyme [Streptomyces]ELP70680.1 putative diaminopimelate decarboxylase [Streptomyces turgidiscabies Car8]MDX3496011.1 type III PLP-dependent enzyme [Streptomyces turgidiscabies]GAQ72500.1 L-glutamyl-[BtrI acyl-carrier protein] [Streptomyces turgidiscabies]